MRKFKILKDTPIDKAGDIFEQDDKLKRYFSNNSQYNKEAVENNPEWFEEIIENKFETDFSKLKDVNGWFIGIGNTGIGEDILNNNWHHSNVFSSESLAKSCLALSQLSQFTKEWNSLVEPEEDVFYTLVQNYRGDLVIDRFGNTTDRRRLYKIKFNSQELAELSLKHHKQLWLDYYEKSDDSTRIS
jgi:hypothetical protein